MSTLRVFLSGFNCKYSNAFRIECASVRTLCRMPSNVDYWYYNGNDYKRNNLNDHGSLQLCGKVREKNSEV